MKRTLIAICTLLVCGAALADTFYLQAAKSRDNGESDKSAWWTAPTGGVNMTNVVESTFSGNRFDLNNNTYNTRNLASSQTFGGTMVNTDSTIYIYSGGYTMAGLDWSAAGSRLGPAIRMRRSNMALNITDLNVVNKMVIRANSTEQNLNLNATTLTGDGMISFGTDNGLSEDGGSIWGLDVGDGSAFSGTIEVYTGNLQFNSILNLNNATLGVSGLSEASVILSNNVTFAAVDFNGNTTLGVGTHTAGELNTFFSTDKFSGESTLTVIPEPATLGLIAAFGGGILFIRRRFMI